MNLPCFHKLWLSGTIRLTLQLTRETPVYRCSRVWIRPGSVPGTHRYWDSTPALPLRKDHDEKNHPANEHLNDGQLLPQHPSSRSRADYFQQIANVDSKAHPVESRNAPTYAKKTAMIDSMCGRSIHSIHSTKGTSMTYRLVWKPAFPAVVVRKPTCCSALAAKRITPAAHIQNTWSHQAESWQIR
jgi:hypothetical protein